MRKIADLVLGLTFCASAFAYLEPGSGSAVISEITGFFIAVGMAVKIYWHKVKSWFSKKERTEQQNEDIEWQSYS